MELITKNQTVEKSNSDSCAVTEYPLNSKDINFAITEINGRYPETGYAKNTGCQELCYIVEGSGIININSKEFELKPGDLLLIDKNEVYYWQGKLKAMLSCSPAWTPEQHMHLDESDAA